MNNGFYKILPLCTFTPLDRVPVWARLFEFGLALTLGPMLTAIGFTSLERLIWAVILDFVIGFFGVYLNLETPDVFA